MREKKKEEEERKEKKGKEEGKKGEKGGSPKGRQARGMKRKRKFLDLKETESLVPGNLEGLLSRVLILLLEVNKALRKRLLIYLV